MAAEETLSEPSYLHIKGEGHTVLKSCFIKICVCKNVSFSQFFHAIKLMTNVRLHIPVLKTNSLI